MITIMSMFLLSLFSSMLWPCFEAGSPNILFILADDMGQWAMGAYGNPDIYTPNLDLLAKEGLQFTNAFCNTPVCSASRASYFTGRLPSQHAVHDFIKGGNGCQDDSHPGIPYTEHEVFYTDVLSKYNYTCGISGKIHIGDQQQPQHSFKHWFVHQSGGGNYNNPPMVKNGQCIISEGYISDIIVDDAIEFLESMAVSNDNPFYLSVHFTAPHSPYTGYDGMANSMHPPEIVALYNNCPFTSCPQEPRTDFFHLRDPLTGVCLGNKECLKGYYAAVTAMDKNIGRLLQTLDILGLDKDTVVVFTSDHGFNAGHHGLWGKGNAAYPLNFFETSLKVPLIWRHRGKIAPGVDHSIVQVLDIAPTLLDYAGGFTFPTGTILPGESYKNLLTSSEARNSLMSRTIYGEYGEGRYGRFGGNVKFVTRRTGYVELYNLTTDAKETINLLEPSLTALHNPNNAAATTFERAVRYWFSYYENPLVSGWALPVTGQGQLRMVAFNSSGWPDTPAFENRGF